MPLSAARRYLAAVALGCVLMMLPWLLASEALHAFVRTGGASHGAGLARELAWLAFNTAVLASVLAWWSRHQRQEEHLLRALVDGAPDSIFVKSLDDRYLMANPACAHITGLSLDQIIGRRSGEVFPEINAEGIAESDRAVLARQAHLTREDQVLMPDGSVRHFQVTKGPLRDAHGRVMAIYGISRDITRLMEMQAALRANEGLLARMSTLAKVGGWSVDANTLQGTRTREAARILDLHPDAGTPSAVVSPLQFFEGEHQRRLAQALHRAVEHGEPYVLELELISATGRRKWIRSHGEPIWQGGKVVRIEGAIQDIGEVWQARQALQAQQAQLEATVQARTAELEAARAEAERLMHIKSEFLANMSHEIRTPLNGVLGFAQIGQRTHTGSAHRIFSQIIESGQLLLGIINDILDFSKIEAGQMHVERLPIDLRALLQRTTEPMAERARAKGIALRVEVSEQLPATWHSDPLRLEQILLNLLSNAVKFTAQGEVSVLATRSGPDLLLRVSDTGIGMTPTQLDDLFRPFKQADGSTTRQYGGTGLGLSITKRLVELLGGRITAHSNGGQGACFEVSLPELGPAHPEQAKPLPGTSPDATSPPPTPLSGRLAGLRVLVAEDNGVNQRVLDELLTQEGAVITMVDNGLAAVQCVRDRGEQAFDLVLMDIQMPTMDGHEATRHILALAPGLPVVGQTAHALSEDRARCLAVGMVDLVVKPIELQQLVSTVLRHARRAGPPH